MVKKIIYDLGANNGDDLPYYLLKADVVIAVEANPVLCELIKERFHKEIKQGKLFIENCVLTAEEDDAQVRFYIRKDDHVRSQFPEPSPDALENYEEVTLPSSSVKHIIEKYGEPYYIKIDIEHYDSQILRALYQGGYFPSFISAESHSLEILSLLIIMGYGAFKLVEGKTVSQEYSSHMISCGEEMLPYSFPYHAAGPFGEDIKGKWMTPENFLRLLAYTGLGWRDIHAARYEKADPSVRPSVKAYIKHFITYRIASRIPKSFKTQVRRFASGIQK